MFEVNDTSRGLKEKKNNFLFMFLREERVVFYFITETLVRKLPAPFQERSVLNAGEIMIKIDKQNISRVCSVFFQTVILIFKSTH